MRVLFDRHGFDVLDVHAVPHSALVIGDEVGRDVGDEYFIKQSMYALLLVPEPTDGVSAFVDGVKPDHAPVCIRRTDLASNPFQVLI
jgi:hypothetical protein